MFGYFFNVYNFSVTKIEFIISSEQAKDINYQISFRTHSYCFWQRNGGQ